MIDYNNIIDNWIGVGKIYKPYSEKIKSIFEVAFENLLKKQLLHRQLFSKPHSIFKTLL